MADQIVLGYNNPETTSAATTTLDVLSVRGWYEFDEIERFPAIQHRYMSGNIDGQNSGFRRKITIDFGVVSLYATQKAILYFLNDDSTRTINLTISAPTGLAVAAATSGGTLTASTTYYYRVTAVNNVGETTGATQASGATGLSPLLQLPLSWNAVSGATAYRIYRTLVSGDYSGEAHYLTEVTTNSHTDTGSPALTTTYVLPTVQSLSVALVRPEGYSNEWLQNFSLARKYVVELYDQTLRTTLRP